MHGQIKNQNWRVNILKIVCSSDKVQYTMHYMKKQDTAYRCYLRGAIWHNLVMLMVMGSDNV